MVASLSLTRHTPETRSPLSAPECGEQGLGMPMGVTQTGTGQCFYCRATYCPFIATSPCNTSKRTCSSPPGLPPYSNHIFKVTHGCMSKPLHRRAISEENHTPASLAFGARCCGGSRCVCSSPPRGKASPGPIRRHVAARTPRRDTEQQPARVWDLVTQQAFKGSPGNTPYDTPSLRHRPHGKDRLRPQL